MRNEKLRVKSWLSHYRKLGVRQFFIVDNGSSDGTLEFLNTQSDVFVESKSGSFSASNFGITWLNEFRRLAGDKKWILFADADELIVYDGFQSQPLAAFVEQVDRTGCNAVFGFILDMYPDGPIDGVNPSESNDLFASAPCFDRDYIFKFPPKKPWASAAETPYVVGGPRVRLLSSFDRESNITWVDTFIRGQIDRLLPLTPPTLVPSLVRLFPKTMPALHKVPLTRGGGQFVYATNHTGAGGNFYRQNVVLCHFKFLSDFVDRVKTEVTRREHYRMGAEYIMYNDIIKRRGSLDLRYAGTLHFNSCDQLKELGLIREVPKHGEGAMAGADGQLCAT
jgi:glycosyltransferase involved in cell wall biosynthesis